MSAETGDYERNQLGAPPSFVELFIAPGRDRPDAPRELIFERYEFCHDLAMLLTEQAGAMLDSAGLSRLEVLRTCHQGLLSDGAPVSVKEAGWTIGHLAELLEWRFEPEDLEG